MTTPSDPPNGASSSVNLNNDAANNALTFPKITKFNLPQFAISDDPKTWFNVAEQIFATQGVNTELEKFGFLLQCLKISDITFVKDIVNSATIADKFTQVKERLKARYGQTEADKVRKLLEGVSVPSNSMPSLILHELRQLTDANENILRGIWIKKLPLKIQEGIAPWTTKPIEEQVEVADLLHKANEDVKPASSVAAVGLSTNTTDQRIDNLLNLVHQLQIQVAAISADRHSRSRDRSPTPHHRYRDNSRSKSRFRFQPKVVNDVCTYHFKFKERAFRCMPGCKFYKKKSENYRAE